jgi:hydroxyacyl-ACP dehydratase HTD2-like protein with hotdog domain
LQLSQLLHGAQSFRFYSPVYVGDHLSCTAEIVKIQNRATSMGPVVTLDLKDDFYRDGNLVIESISSLLVREETT